jgi:hypothetical protein
MTSAHCHPGVPDSIELHNGNAINQASDDQGLLGKSAMQVPEYEDQCEKRCSNSRVVSDGDRYAATVSDEAE